MTNEELDLLASTYVDGQATPEEMALVERDPELGRRVEELRAMANLLQVQPTPSANKEAHLAAALAAFGSSERRMVVQPIGGDDQGAPTVDGRPPMEHEPVDQTAAADGVIDLTSRRQERNASRMRWLSAAAAVMVLSFGAVFLAGQMNSADDSFEAAVDAANESDDAADDSAAAFDEAVEGDFDDAMADDAAESTAADSAQVQAAPLAETDAAEDAEEDLATGADSDAAEEEAADEAEPIGPPTIEDLPASGFFPDEPVVFYANVPSSDDMINDLSLRWRDPNGSSCSQTVELPDNAEVIAYLPVEVTNPDASTEVVEALYLVEGADTRIVLAAQEDCTIR